MFAVTIDQVDSRSNNDLVGGALDTVNGRYGAALALRAERTAGDEFQLLTRDAATVLDIVLRMTRAGVWSVGVGIGAVRHPLPDSAREASGDALYAARAAVERAKKSGTRFALEELPVDDKAVVRGRDLEALMDLVVALRERRTDGGWEIADLLAGGMSQKEAAARLGISAAAASLRIKAAGIRLEENATAALERLLAEAGRRHE